MAMGRTRDRALSGKAQTNGQLRADWPTPRACGSERALLAYVIRLPNAVAHVRATGLQPHELFSRDHSLILKEAYRLNDSGADPDFAFLNEQIGHKLDGGPAYLASLLDDAVKLAPSNIAHHVREIRLAFVARQQLQVLREGADQLLADFRIVGDGFSSNLAQRLQSVAATTADQSQRNSMFRTAKVLASATPEHPDWIAKPWVARGALTELASKPKVGKTTLVLGLVRAVVEAVPFLDGATCSTSVVYLTEERPATFREALRRAGLLDREDLSVLSFSDVHGSTWQEIVGLADHECARTGADLLVVDTLSQFAGLQGDAENNAGDALLALAPLQRVAATGRAVLLTRHERKSGGEVGESGRGSGAFAGAVDVVLALRRQEGRIRPTVRVLHGLSRFDETPGTLVIERIHSVQLVPGVWADSFVSLGSETSVATAEARDALQSLPTTEGEAESLKDIQTDHPSLSRSALQRALDSLMTEGTVRKAGSGRRGDPFRYFRPETLTAQTPHLVGQNETAGNGATKA